ncbi:MAG: septum site-determining protein MinC [Peptococcaceae bacterium]|nr:septum site-determining protein MinC [Peptococcaceae bacterium]
MNRITDVKFSGNVVTAMAGEAVSIKGTRRGLVILFNPDLDLEEIKSTLREKMENSGGFFKGAKFTVHDFNTGRNDHYVRELEVICRQYGLIPSTDVSWPPASGGYTRNEPATAGKKKASVIPIGQQAHPEGEPAILVPRTLRSGQRVFSRHSIVIMGDLNPGAEAVSENSIYVLGSCKGSVHAGAGGNLMAEVAALKLQPSVLRIGSIAADAGFSVDSAVPAAARVNRGKIVAGKL